MIILNNTRVRGAFNFDLMTSKFIEGLCVDEDNRNYSTSELDSDIYDILIHDEDLDNIPSIKYKVTFMYSGNRIDSKRILYCLDRYLVFIKKRGIVTYDCIDKKEYVVHIPKEVKQYLVGVLV